MSYHYMGRWSKGRLDPVLHHPTGIALDQNGRLYAVNTNRHEIVVYDEAGELLDRWGAWGSGTAEFYLPTGIALDQDGNAYVSDTYNHRIQKFDRQGRFLLAFGTRGSENGCFHFPHGITVDERNRVYVADTHNHRIQRFTADGIWLDSFGHYCNVEFETDKTAPGFNRPFDVATDADYIYVSDSLNRRVCIFDMNGSLVRQVGRREKQPIDYDNYDPYPEPDPGELQHPSGVAADGEGNWFVTDAYLGYTQQFDAQGRFVAKLGEFDMEGDGPKERLQVLHGLCFDRHGSLIHSDAGMNRIVYHDANGHYSRHIGDQSGTAFVLPKSIAIDRNDNLYVRFEPADVKKLDAEGRLLTPFSLRELPEFDQLREHLHLIPALGLDRDGERIYVGTCDTAEPDFYIHTLDLTGKLLRTFAHPKRSGYHHMEGLHVRGTPEGHIMIVDDYLRGSKVTAYNEAGQMLHEWHTLADPIMDDLSGHWRREGGKLTLTMKGRPGDEDIMIGYGDWIKEDEIFTEEELANGITLADNYAIGDLTYAPDGTFYMAYGDGVARYRMTGELMQRWRFNQGKGPGEFDEAKAIAFDNLGRLSILDYNNHRIQFCDLEMNVLEEMRLDSFDHGEVRYPQAFAFDSRGNLFVIADYAVYKYERYGALRPDLERNQAERTPISYAALAKGWNHISSPALYS
ncbi:NHL repeat-containing protein [Paenibacillus methanolicus]|uniref:NHL repeat-containing protein n=1 Tax=Paenibacillus methanolicus TaxID=582686 RepID=A0A5S5CJW3_9BACL|nr:NHL repeat-containing protein [Paenibacillus methanolicus]TYP79197.1 NHL repeat-containing protein [Paenibacillus methanolicus]